LRSFSDPAAWMPPPMIVLLSNGSSPKFGVCHVTYRPIEQKSLRSRQ
jgi:hypothetical protein